MSLYDYKMSKAIALQCHPFAALVMAAMQGADSENLRKLRDAFPHIHHELTLRYHAPGGELPDER